MIINIFLTFTKSAICLNRTTDRVLYEYVLDVKNVLCALYTHQRFIHSRKTLLWNIILPAITFVTTT